MLGKQFSFSCLCLLVSLACAAADLPKTYKVVIPAPYSGLYRGYGTQLLAGASQAVEAINQTGGIYGIPLEIIPLDDRCDPQDATTLAKRIANNAQYHAVIGHACAAATFAAVDTYANAKLLMLTPTPAEPKITQKGILTLFRLTGNEMQQAHVAAQFMVNKLQAKRVAVLHDQDPYSKALVDTFNEQLLATPASPVLYLELEPGTRKFEPLVQKILTLQADAIYFVGHYPEVGGLVKALSQAKAQIPLMTSDIIATKQFVTAAGNGKNVQSVLMTFPHIDTQLPRLREAQAQLQANQLDDHGHTLNAYAAIEIVAQAFKATQQSTQSPADWLHHHTVHTILGPKSWDTNGDLNKVTYRVHIWDEQGHYREL